MSSSSAPLKTHRVGEGLMQAKYVEARTSSRWCGVERRSCDDFIFGIIRNSNPDPIFTILPLTPRAEGSNTGEGMDVFKCIVPVWHGSTLNRRRATSPHLRLVEGAERWETSDHPHL
ncbi:hypothetical protein TNCV_4768751 [Trichonephila clavipes]|nr:hypothetical protein TNCV_4768751 [Trichonephila clavipes]